MAEAWMRLDTGFYLDHKIEDLEAVKRGEGVYRWIKLCCIAHEHYGQLDLNARAMRTHVEKRMNLKGKHLDDFISVCVECGLFDAEKWEMKIITSGRLMTEGTKRYNAEQQRREAAERAAEARRSKALTREMEETKS